jgi:hypothetical protein
MNKQCEDCKGSKNVKEFYESSLTWDGYEHVCKVCKKDRVAAVYRATKEDRILQILEWQVENEDKVKAYKRKYKQKEKHEKECRKNAQCDGQLD